MVSWDESVCIPSRESRNLGAVTLCDDLFVVDIFLVKGSCVGLIGLGASLQWVIVFNLLLDESLWELKREQNWNLHMRLQRVAVILGGKNVMY